MELELVGAEKSVPDRTGQSEAAGAASLKAEGGSYVAPSRQQMKRIQGYFSPRVKRQLRMLAAQEDKTEEQLVGEALNLLFQTHGLPSIAFEGKEGVS
jgi:hypothetical protein